jgi:2-methylcitrate dehydratase PrpD
MTVTRRLAEFGASLTYGDLPEETVVAAKRVLVDTVGTAVGSVRAESNPVVLDTVRGLDADGDGATVLPTGEQRSPQYAAMANGTFAHTLDYDETHRSGGAHAAAPVLAATLATGERVDASGEEFLAAFVAGYDVTARLGMAVDPGAHSDRGFHVTATCGTFGATAAAAVLHDLSADELATAFGLNGSQAAGSLQFLENGAWNKRLHPGLAANRAIVATDLARRGFQASVDPIEGEKGFLNAYTDDPHPDRALDGLGDRFEVTRSGLKPYPCCRYMHAPMDALLAIADREDVDPARVASVIVEVAETAVDIVGTHPGDYPETLVDAQFSMPFGVALTLARRDAGVDALFDAVGEQTATMRRLMDATTVRSNDRVEALYPDQWAADVTVELADGTVYEGRVNDARGDRENPLSESAIRSKFDELARPVHGDAATALYDRLQDIESYSVRDLLAPIRA